MGATARSWGSPAPLLETLLDGKKASLAELRSSFREAVLAAMLIGPG